MSHICFQFSETTHLLNKKSQNDKIIKNTEELEAGKEENGEVTIEDFFYEEGYFSLYNCENETLNLIDGCNKG